MSESSSLSQPEQDELVAYLDGELKGEAARSVERRIASNPALRAEAESLRRAWEMLDFLWQPEPSEHFTNRTMQKVAPVTATAPTIGRPRSRRLAYLMTAGWVAAVVLAIAAGYGTSRRAAPRAPGDRELVRDLRVIDNKRLYDAADDLDFVRELDVPELFGDDSAGT